MRPPGQGALDAPVLVAQGDLQVEDGLAVALEAEVARLDDARVDGTHGHLVDRLALDAEEVHDGGLGVLPDLPALRPGAVEADRLQPGVALGQDPELLRQLPFEEVGLGTVGGQGRVGGTGEAGPGGAEPALGVVGQHGVEGQLRVGAETGQAQALPGAAHDPVAELGEGELGHLLEGQGLPVADGDEQAGAHGRPSTHSLAFWSIAPRGRGSHRPSTSERPRAITRGAVVAKVSL